eukprot:30103-Chlamydomonas_euryale.AAC.3
MPDTAGCPLGDEARHSWCSRSRNAPAVCQPARCAQSHFGWAVRCAQRHRACTLVSRAWFGLSTPPRLLQARPVGRWLARRAPPCGRASSAVGASCRRPVEAGGAPVSVCERTRAGLRTSSATMSHVKLRKFLLRYYPPGIILQYERDGVMMQKPVDLLDLTPDADIEVGDSCAEAGPCGLAANTS